MSSSSRAMTRVLRGEAGRRAPTETFGIALPGVRNGDQDAGNDPFAAVRAAGYQEGFAAGVEDAAAGDEAAKSARVARLTEALTAAADEARTQRAEVLARAEREAVELAFELARALLGRELRLSPAASVDAVTRALAHVPEGEDLVVRLHPDDVLGPEDLHAIVADASIRIVHDPDVEPGGCVVEAGPCRIDAQVGPALERARALIDSVGTAPGES